MVITTNQWGSRDTAAPAEGKLKGAGPPVVPRVELTIKGYPLLVCLIDILLIFPTIFGVDNKWLVAYFPNQ